MTRRVQRQGDRRGGGCRFERGGIAQRLTELQGAAAHAFVADAAIDRQKVPEHASRDPLRHEGGQAGLELIEFGRRSAAHWPADSGLHRAAAGAAEAGQTDGDLTEQGSDLARAVILDATGLCPKTRCRRDHFDSRSLFCCGRFAFFSCAPEVRKNPKYAACCPVVCAAAWFGHEVSPSTIAARGAALFPARWRNYCMF